ncbi:unnamed protein product [Knipowitschia caucasica]
MAAFVDPRFKTRYISPEQVEAIKERVLCEMMDEDPSQSEAEIPEGTGGQGAEEEGATSLPLGVKKQRKSLGSFFKIPSQDDEQDAVPLTERQKVEMEMKSYSKCLDADGESDPLQWWKVHERKFPRMSQLAKKYLCIPATSSPSERIFSTGGNIVTCTRAALKPEMVNQLVFLAQNLK